MVNRLAGDDTRPLLQGDNVEEKVRKLLDERRPVYEAAADAVIPVAGIEVDDIVAEILEVIR